MNKRSYLLVMYPVSNSIKWVSMARQESINEETAKVLLQEANATIIRKNVKWKVQDKRLFEYANLDGSVTLVIIVDVIKES